jgi:flagellar protein FliT
VLQCYERALELTRAMLEAARASDWDRLVLLEQERALLVERVSLEDPDPGRDPASRERKREIIVQMLRLDEQIQLLTQDWMHELRDVLRSISAEQRLNRTYGP